jgi:hypothetical protein
MSEPEKMTPLLLDACPLAHILKVSLPKKLKERLEVLRGMGNEEAMKFLKGENSKPGSEEGKKLQISALLYEVEADTYETIAAHIVRSSEVFINIPCLDSGLLAATSFLAKKATPVPALEKPEYFGNCCLLAKLLISEMPQYLKKKKEASTLESNEQAMKYLKAYMKDPEGKEAADAKLEALKKERIATAYSNAIDILAGVVQGREGVLSKEMPCVAARIAKACTW